MIYLLLIFLSYLVGLYLGNSVSRGSCWPNEQRWRVYAAVIVFSGRNKVLMGGKLELASRVMGNCGMNLQFISFASLARLNMPVVDF